MATWLSRTRRPRSPAVYTERPLPTVPLLQEATERGASHQVGPTPTLAREERLWARVGSLVLASPPHSGRRSPHGQRTVVPDFTRVHRDREGDLRQWAGLIRSLEGKVDRAFAFVNNQFEGHSPDTVRRLMRYLAEGSAGE